MVLALLLAACVKPTPPAALGNGATLTVVGVVDVAGNEPAAGTPAAFDSALLGTVRARALAPALREEEEVFTLLTGQRESGRRLVALGNGQPNALLLVETSPRYYSELSGQYRWVVAVKLSVVGADGAVIEEAFDVPVFLRWHHEREPEAVNAAAPVVERRLGELLDRFVSGAG